MNRWKLAFWIVVPILTASLLITVYMVIDNGITITYMRVGYEDTVRSYEALAEVFPKNQTKKDIVFVLRKSNPNMFIAEEKTLVRSEAGIFYFNQSGTLEKVSLR